MEGSLLGPEQLLLVCLFSACLGYRGRYYCIT